MREARDSDVPRLVEIETQVWKPLGTEVFTPGHFHAWLEIDPRLLLVAVVKGNIYGYTYTQEIDFDFGDLSAFTTFDSFTDRGYTRSTRVKGGNSLFGVTIASVGHGAGKVLHAANLALTHTLRKEYFVTTSRISGFDEYMRVPEVASAFLNAEPLLEADAALWYTMKCMKMLNGKIWPTCPREPMLVLPSPKVPDPVLASHLRTTKELGLAAVLAQFMNDPSSRNYAALSVYQNTSPPGK